MVVLEVLRVVILKVSIVVEGGGLDKDDVVRIVLNPSFEPESLE